MEGTAQDQPPCRAALAGRLLGCEVAWLHGGIGQRVSGEALHALALSHWEAEGHLLAGPCSHYDAFLGAFLEAYGSTVLPAESALYPQTSPQRATLSRILVNLR